MSLSQEKQTKLHDPAKGIKGNCMVACYANVLDIPISSCPAFEELFSCKKPNGFWWDAVVLWWKLMGYDYGCVETHEQAIELANGGYYFVSGKSPRFPDSYHLVIYRDGKLEFDPHPDGTGLLTEEYFECYVKTNQDGKK